MLLQSMPALACGELGDATYILRRGDAPGWKAPKSQVGLDRGD